MDSTSVHLLIVVVHESPFDLRWQRGRSGSSVDRNIHRIGRGRGRGTLAAIEKRSNAAMAYANGCAEEKLACADGCLTTDFRCLSS